MGSSASRPLPAHGVAGWLHRFASRPEFGSGASALHPCGLRAGARDVPGTGVTVTEGKGWAVGLAAALMAGATATAFVLRRPEIPIRAAMLIPLVDLIAIGLLRGGTGGASSVFDSLLILAVLSLGVEPGWLPLFIGAPMIFGDVFLTQLFDPAGASDGQWTRVIFEPLILILTALSTNELTRRLRSRLRAVQALRQQQEVLLAEAHDNVTASIAASNLIQESAHQMARRTRRRYRAVDHRHRSFGLDRRVQHRRAEDARRCRA